MAPQGVYPSNKNIIKPPQTLSWDWEQVTSYGSFWCSADWQNWSDGGFFGFAGEAAETLEREFRYLSKIVVPADRRPKFAGTIFGASDWLKRKF